MNESVKQRPYRALHHIGYWVDDLAAAVQWAESFLGAGPFTVLDHIDVGASFRFQGRPAEFDHSAAFGQWGPVILELGTVHRIDPDLATALHVGHGNVSHVAWTTDDIAREDDAMAATGCALLTSSRSVACADWFEGGPVFGHPIEVHEPTAPVLGMWQSVHDAAAHRNS